MIAKAGAGPKPVPFKQMTPQSLAASITLALKEEVGIAVKEMAAQIAEEDGAQGAVHDIEHALDMDEMRCQMCPERLALWIDKKTGTHLSGMAASTLAEKKLIHPKQLRL
jgi:sterol 3beta-glucosyltransferase